MQSNASSLIQQSQFIRAGAGAGKTTRLIGTFLEFVREFKSVNGRLPRVVMTTFTRKATQEVKERLLVSALNQNEREIFEYINQKYYVHISTIHGMLSLFLTQNAQSLQFPQEIKIVEGPQQLRMIKKQINELLKSNDRFLKLLETYRFNELVKVSIAAVDLKAQYRNFSYLPKSEMIRLADEKRKSLIELIAGILEFAPTANDKWEVYLDYLRALKVAVQSADLTRTREVIESKPKKPQFRSTAPSIDPAANQLISEDLDAALEMLWPSPELIESHDVLNSIFSEFVSKLYEVNYRYKQRTGELSISDLENLSLKLIEEHPQVAEEFSNSWDYFMIDEYQDTSPLQVRILNLIVGERVCFIVGDPQQSIYLFRGARSEVFETKQRELAARNARVDFLQTNYRSEPHLMNFINDFFSRFSTQFKPMLVKPESARADSKLNLSADAYYIQGDDQIISSIKQIRFLISCGARPADICILSRSNRNLEELAVAAKKSGLNVQLQAAAGFDLKREILDLIALLRFLNNPHDDVNFVTLARSPWLYVSDVMLVEMAGRKRSGQSFWNLLNLEPGESREKFDRYLKLFDSMGALQTLKQFLFDTDFLNYSEYYDPTGKREANISKFLFALAGTEKTPGFSLGLFLDEQFSSISVDSGAANGEAQPVLQPDCVSLMTVHASKGLQFKHVIFIGMADMIRNSNVANLSFEPESQYFSLAPLDKETFKPKPTIWAQELREIFVEREKQESERVLYVGMTRAIESLSLIAETKSNPRSNTWYARMNWPPIGEHTAGDFTVRSLSFDVILENSEAAEKVAGQLRPKFREVQVGLDASESVTNLISTPATGLEVFNAEKQLDNLKKAQYGTDLHRIFEALKYLDFAAVKARLTDDDRRAVDYLEQLQTPPLLQVLRHGHNEWGFGLKTVSRIIQGQIDLWGELESEIHVLDYKTGSSQYAEKAFDQLSLYTKALLQMKQISRNKAIVHSVIYPLEKTTKIRKYADAAEFEAQLSAKILELF